MKSEKRHFCKKRAPAAAWKTSTGLTHVIESQECHFCWTKGACSSQEDLNRADTCYKISQTSSSQKKKTLWQLLRQLGRLHRANVTANTSMKCWKNVVKCVRLALNVFECRQILVNAVKCGENVIKCCQMTFKCCGMPVNGMKLCLIVVDGIKMGPHDKHPKVYTFVLLTVHLIPPHHYSPLASPAPFRSCSKMFKLFQSLSVLFCITVMDAYWTVSFLVCVP